MWGIHDPPGRSHSLNYFAVSPRKPLGGTGVAGDAVLLSTRTSVGGNANELVYPPVFAIRVNTVFFIVPAG